MFLLLLACARPPEGDEAGAGAAETGAPGGGADTGLDVASIDPDRLPAGDHPCREPVLVEVTHVVDGDTAWVEGEAGAEDVRFIGVDTPELGWDGGPDDCYGPEAADFTRAVLEGRRVWLTFDGDCVDPYGRTLAYVHTGEDAQGFFQRVLLRGGYARTLTFEETDTFAGLFESDEAWAREHGEGGWGACGW